MEVPPPPIGNEVKTNSYLIFHRLNRKHGQNQLTLINHENKCHLSTKASIECTLMGGIRVGKGGEWFSGSYLLVL